jgi:hypothetical protein
MSIFICLRGKHVTLITGITLILACLGYFVNKNNVNTLTKNNQVIIQTTKELSVVVIKSVSQLSDIQPKDEAYQVLRNLINDYGIMIAYSDGTFRGNRVLTRYELAVTLHSTVKEADRIVAAIIAPYATKQQITKLIHLQNNLATDIEYLQNQLNILKGNQSIASDLSRLFINNQVLEQVSVLPVKFNTRITSKEEASQTQVTSLSDIVDVEPTDWAFEALRSLIERYGLVTELIYPDRTFRGNRALTRYEFATILNNALEQIGRLSNNATNESATKAEAELLIRTQEDLESEIEALRTRVNQLKIQLSKNNYSDLKLVIYRNLEQTKAPQIQFDSNIMQEKFITSQITLAQQIPDVRDTHWAYEAIRALVEREEVLSVYSDGTFRGNRGATRYEFANVLNTALYQIEQLLVAYSINDIPTKKQLSELQGYQDAFALEIGKLQEQIEQLEASKSE